jgi:hypothetical protein
MNMTEINNQLGHYVRFKKYIEYKIGQKSYYTKKKKMNECFKYFLVYIEKNTHKKLIRMNQTDLNNEFDMFYTLCMRREKIEMIRSIKNK